MNNRQRKTLAGIFEDPIRSDIRWSEFKSLLEACGATVQERRGSRVGIELNGVRAVLHRPHPGDEINKSTLKDIRDFMVKAGVTP